MDSIREIEKIREEIEKLKNSLATPEEQNELLLEKDRLQREIPSLEQTLSELEKDSELKYVELDDKEELDYLIFNKEFEYNTLTAEIATLDMNINTLNLEGDGYNQVPELVSRKEELQSKLNDTKESLLNDLETLIKDTQSKINSIETMQTSLKDRNTYNTQMLSEEELQKQLSELEKQKEPLLKLIENQKEIYDNIANNNISKIEFDENLKDLFEIRNTHKRINSLEAEIESLRISKEQEKTFNPGLVSEEELSKYDRKIEELQKEIEKNNSKLTEIINKKVSSIDGEINTLKSNKEQLELYTPGMTSNEDIEKINKQIEELERKQKKFKGLLPKGIETYKWDKNLTDSQKEELWGKGILPGTKEYEDKLVELNIISDKRKANEIRKKINEGHQRIDYIESSKSNNQRLAELQKIEKSYVDAIEEISNEVINNIQIDDNMTEEEINKIIRDNIDNITKTNKDVENFKLWSNEGKLTEEAKEDIEKAVKEKLEKNKEKETDPEIIDPIEPETPEVEEEKPEELIDEPDDEITIEPQKDGKLWLKALSGAAGFAAGVGLNVAVSAVPLLGGVITVYAAARTIYNVAKLVNNITTKLNKNQELAMITEIKNKIPEPVKKACKAIFEKPKNPYAKWFVNGMSIGYLADRVFNIHEGLTAKADTISNTEPITNDISGQSAPGNLETIPNLAEINIGDSVDLSSITHGYASSFGEGFTSLDTTRGVGAIFDTTNMVNGKLWYHFLQPNGEGYAWFPKEVIDEALKQGVSVGRGIH